MASRVWCARASYVVKQSASEVIGLVQDVDQDRPANRFVWLDLDNGIQVTLAVAHISAIEPA